MNKETGVRRCEDRKEEQRKKRTWVKKCKITRWQMEHSNEMLRLKRAVRCAHLGSD